MVFPVYKTSDAKAPAPENYGTLSSLPSELILEICKFLDHTSLVHLGLSSKAIAQYVNPFCKPVVLHNQFSQYLKQVKETSAALNIKSLGRVVRHTFFYPVCRAYDAKGRIYFYETDFIESVVIIDPRGSVICQTLMVLSKEKYAEIIVLGDRGFALYSDQSVLLCSFQNGQATCEGEFFIPKTFPAKEGDLSPFKLVDGRRRSEDTLVFRAAVGDGCTVLEFSLSSKEFFYVELPDAIKSKNPLDAKPARYLTSYLPNLPAFMLRECPEPKGECIWNVSKVKHLHQYVLDRDGEYVPIVTVMEDMVRRIVSNRKWTVHHRCFGDMIYGLEHASTTFSVKKKSVFDLFFTGFFGEGKPSAYGRLPFDPLTPSWAHSYSGPCSRYSGGPSPHRQGDI